MVGVVYKITNNINGKIYFGITKCSIQKRWREHTCNAGKVKRKTHINRAIRKYGKDNFSIKIFKTCYTNEQLYKSEIYFIKFYNTTNRDIGYNNSTGGEMSAVGIKHSEETKRLIGIKSKGHPPNKTSFKKGHSYVMSENQKRKIGDANIGKKRLPEVIEAIRKRQIGKKTGPMSESTKMKISLSNMGKKMSPEFCKKLSERKKGKPGNRQGAKHTEESKIKMSLGNKGKIHSDFTRLKRSLALKQYWSFKKSA